MKRPLFSLVCLIPLAVVMADGPGDNVPDKVRPIPPVGIKVPDDVRAELRAGTDDLLARIRAHTARPDYLPDVEVFAKAVDWALKYGEFFDAKEFAVAKRLLATGKGRLDELVVGTAKPSWIAATGPVIRGYRSKIDGSIQPYGLVVPKDLDRDKPARLDLWWHGRFENVTELKFINDRMTSAGPFTPPGALVLHPFGRFSNANRFAGEVDTFEAMDHVRRDYKIDDERIVARGFSMGGAACWTYATHFPSLWAAAAPGAGFSETADFLKVFQRETLKPTVWEQKLWHLYDATDYAANLYNLPTVAYSGELDSQKQAADMMATAMKSERMELVHLIGPKTKHAYHAETKKDLSARIDDIVAKGKDPQPNRVRFTTWTLRYPQSHWVRIDGMVEHWKRARVDATRDSEGRVTATTENVTALTLTKAGLRPTIDGQTLDLPAQESLSLSKVGDRWELAAKAGRAVGLAKIHGLQGPIDDAFYDKFLFVRPTGSPMNEKVGAWAKAEFDHAVAQWRQVFRGDAPVTDDAKLTEKDIATANLVLWGDPKSNAVLAKIADKLPVKWSATGVVVGTKIYPAETHVPILICPNPLNPARYVVLNSGFTFREYDALNNARQTPKLPDWAVVDVTTPPSSRWPGKVVAADFFDESWKLK
ncbi:MAG: prolyl oligopeptidase family serine peptidase [Gemmataceae bacterium]